MTAGALACFGLRADIELPAPPHHSLCHRSAWHLEQLGRAVEGAGLVVCQGDTTSALAGAIAGFLSGAAVVHVEAGLRTGDLEHPFPEEGHRQMISRIATIHLAPTVEARDRLVAEGIDDRVIAVTGNTVISALHLVVARTHEFENTALRAARGPMVMITAHRRESWGEPLGRVAGAVAGLAALRPDITWIWVQHDNPQVRAGIDPVLERGPANLIRVPKLSYGDTCLLLSRIELLITDSGGLQEEAPTFGVPVVVTRRTTERPEGVAAGFATLVGTDPVAIRNAVTAGLAGGRVRAANPFGDRWSARRAAEAIAALASRTENGHRPAA